MTNEKDTTWYQDTKTLHILDDPADHNATIFDEIRHTLQTLERKIRDRHHLERHIIHASLSLGQNYTADGRCLQLDTTILVK